MIRVGTSVWIEIFRQNTGNIGNAVQQAPGAENYAASRLFPDREAGITGIDIQPWFSGTM
jgi:hypothetical protein